jgi:hypothetical protein
MSLTSTHGLTPRCSRRAARGRLVVNRKDEDVRLAAERETLTRDNAAMVTYRLKRCGCWSNVDLGSVNR